MTTGDPTIEGLARDLAPQALAVVARRTTSFADCEDAVQEALIRAARSWPVDGVPDRPLGWLIRVASRQLISRHHTDSARRRREAVVAAWALNPPDPVGDRDDTLTVLFMCCHESLTPRAAIPLTLRAVGGLTTREIAAAFLVKEATIAQRISRAKATIQASATPFAMPEAQALPQRLRSVLHVLYLTFNEGYTASAGSELGRPDLAAEAIRLTRIVQRARPEDPEVEGLLALMLLTEARRAARSGPGGELIPLEAQDRGRWDRGMIREGVQRITAALRRHMPGEYQLQAAIAAIHTQAPSHEETGWEQVLALYEALARMSGNPVVLLNRAVAMAMVHGPGPALDAVDELADALADHHRYHAVRADLLERAGRPGEAITAYERAIQRVTNVRERDHLQARAASNRSRRRSPDGVG